MIFRKAQTATPAANSTPATTNSADPANKEKALDVKSTNVVDQEEESKKQCDYCCK